MQPFSLRLRGSYPYVIAVAQGRRKTGRKNGETKRQDRQTTRERDARERKTERAGLNPNRYRHTLLHRPRMGPRSHAPRRSKQTAGQTLRHCSDSSPQQGRAWGLRHSDHGGQSLHLAGSMSLSPDYAPNAPSSAIGDDVTSRERGAASRHPPPRQPAILLLLLVFCQPGHRPKFLDQLPRLALSPYVRSTQNSVELHTLTGSLALTDVMNYALFSPPYCRACFPLPATRYPSSPWASRPIVQGSGISLPIGKHVL